MMINGEEEDEKEVDVFKLDTWKCPDKYLVLLKFLNSVPF